MITSVNLSKSPSLALDRAGGLRKSLWIATPHRSLVSRATAAGLVLAATLAVAAPSLAHADPALQGSKARTIPPSGLRKVRLDHSGDKRVGMASCYGRRFSGRKMADGTPMKPESDNAASRTLPLGTTAQVTNLSDGKTAMVTIRDRGPYAKGRIIDLSPRTARQLGIAGVVRVEVTPINVAQPNARLKSLVARSEPETSGAQRGVL